MTTEIELKKRALLIGTFAILLSFVSKFLVTLKIESILVFILEGITLIAALALEDKNIDKKVVRNIKIVLLVLAIFLFAYSMTEFKVCIPCYPEPSPILFGFLLLISQFIYLSVFIWAVAGGKVMRFLIKILGVLMLIYIIINVLF